jgi:hypothetical protein
MPAGIVIYFKGVWRRSVRKSAKSKTSKTLHLSGVDCLKIEPLFPAPPKPLIFCDFDAGAEKLMGPEPKGRKRRIMTQKAAL